MTIYIVTKWHPDTRGHLWWWFQTGRNYPAKYKGGSPITSDLGDGKTFRLEYKTK